MSVPQMRSWGIWVAAPIACLAVVFAAAQSDRPAKDSAAGETKPIPTNLLQRVLPAHDSQLTRSVEIVADNGAKWTFYVAASGGQYAGAAFESSSGGYGGPVRVLVGVNSNGTVQAVEILEQRETKGLGARIAEPAFRAQFSGKDIQKTRWRTKRRGGDIDQITGATVSSDAVAAAVKAGLAVYAKNLATLRRAAPSANGAGKTAKPSE